MNQSSGIATIKVRIPDQPGGTKLITLEIPLTDIGNDLRCKIASHLAQTPSRIKMISSGKVIDNDKTLESQGVTNNHQILALILATTPEECQNEDMIYDHVKNTKADAETLLMKRNTFMQV